MKKIIVIDIASTDQGAYRLLRTRVQKINSNSSFENYILCPSGEWADKIKKIGIKHIPWEITRKINLFGVIKEIKKLESILQDINPDIVHSHNSKSGAIARIAIGNLNKRNNRKIKMIHQVHGYHFTKYKGIKKFVFLNIEKYLSKKTDVLLFQNKYELQLSKQAKMNKNCKLEYIGNGINLDEMKICSLESNQNDDKDIKQIVCVARLEKIKNHEMIIRSLGILKRDFKFDKFKALFIGEGSKEVFFDLIKKNNLEDNIIFTGQLDRKDVVQKVNESDICVLSSIKEGKPRALIEGLILGKPCVATNVVGTNEVVINEKNGYLVNLNDDYAFAKCIYELCTNNKLYKRFSEDARIYAKNEFDEDRVIEKVKEIYKFNKQ